MTEEEIKKFWLDYLDKMDIKQLILDVCIPSPFPKVEFKED